MAEKSNQKRQIAYKILIKDVINGKYVKEGGWNPNYILTDSGLQVSRLNVLATVIDKVLDSNMQWSSIIVDDGSGKIGIRSFDSNQNLDVYSIGDPLLVIGRIREFNNQKYILPEVIKKIDNDKWIKLRRIELRKEGKNEELEVYDVGSEVIDDNCGVFSIIKKLDKGDGADINEIIKISSDKNTEKLINNMIKMGEVFEAKPGKVKILE